MHYFHLAEQIPLRGKRRLRSCNASSSQHEGLERDIVVGDAHVRIVGRVGGGALVVAGAVGFGVAAGGGSFAARFTAEQGQFIAQDLGLVFLFAAGLVIPGAGLALAFEGF